MKLNLVRWDSVVRKAAELYPQPCSWGGFQSELLSFVPIDSPWVEKWRVECEQKHGVRMVPSFYTLGLNPMSYEEFIREALKEYSKGQSRLTQLGIFVTLEEVKGGYEIVEIRFNQPSPLQYLMDKE